MKRLCRRIRKLIAKVIRWSKKKQVESMTHGAKMWIDLTPVGLEPVLCDCEISIGERGILEFYRAVVPFSSGDSFARLFNGTFNEGGLAWDVETSGTLEDGRPFVARIGSITSCSLSRPDFMDVDGTLSEVSVGSPETERPQEWVFLLSNVKLFQADLWSDYPEQKRKAADSIEFTTNERTWRLTDAWSHKWKKISKREQGKPIISGVLRTEFLEGDADEDLKEVVQDISHVLAMAFSRSVNWISYSLNGADGKCIRGYSRSAWVTAFNKHGFDPINNYSPGSLKTLLELSLPIIATDRDWYSKTLGMLTQAQIADMMDIRCSVLYTLADRISSFLVEKSGTAEIDPELKARARKPEFVEEIHKVLQKLSPENWTKDNTNSVLGEIKRWNKTPSFVVKIQRACARLTLPEPDKTLLQPRNDLLHDGELTSKYDDNLKHYLELDWTVLTLVLRLFDYEGTYAHPRCGDEPVELSGQLSPRT